MCNEFFIALIYSFLKIFFLLAFACLVTFNKTHNKCQRKNLLTLIRHCSWIRFSSWSHLNLELLTICIYMIMWSMHDAPVKTVWLTRPPRILGLARSLPVARAGRSRFCSGEGRRSRAASEEDPAQMKGATSMETDTGSHSPPALRGRAWLSKILLKIL